MSFFNSQSIKVLRPTSGHYVNGRWEDAGAPEIFNISGTVQPTTGEKLEVLLEGKRAEKIVEIITSTKLRATNPETQTKGDNVEIDGEVFEIIQALGWRNGLLPHYSCIAIKEKER